MTTKKTKRPSHVHRDFGPLLNPTHRPAKNGPHIDLQGIELQLSLLVDHAQGALDTLRRGEYSAAARLTTELELRARHLRKVRWCRQPAEVTHA